MRAVGSHQRVAAVMVVVQFVVEAFDVGEVLVAADLGKEEPVPGRLVRGDLP